MRDVCPLVVLAHAKRDLQRADAEASSWTAKLGGAPDFEALSGFLRSSASKKLKSAGSLRALGEGGWWGQERLFNAGMVSDPFCQICAPVAGKPYDTVQCYVQALEADPKDAVAWRNLGVAGGGTVAGNP